MRKIYTILALTLLSTQLPVNVNAQSNCASPKIDYYYNNDIGGIALKDMYARGVAAGVIEIPVTLRREIKEGMAAIFNSIWPERDTVFDMYCIHDPAAVATGKGLNIFFDDSYSWTDAWKNGQTYTGNQSVDELMTKYKLKVTAYHYYQYLPGYHHSVSVEADDILNMPELAKEFVKIAGINYAEGSSTVGDLSESINYRKQGNDRIYEFSIKWGDCPAGCIAHRTWQFTVDQNCNATFVKAWEGGGDIGPRPGFKNCDITHKELNVGHANGVTKSVKVFPNPASDLITIEYSDDNTYNTVFTLTDITGHTIKQVTLNSDRSKVNAVDVPAGVYFYKIKSATITLDSGKLLIVK